MKNKRTLTKEQFIAKSDILYKNKYDYSKVNYINNRTKVFIICPKHGGFWKVPYKHLIGQGCSECAKIEKKKKLTSDKDVFIEKAKKLYGSKYGYDKVKYINSKTKAEITCQKHGGFLITPNNFLRGHECPKCKGEKISSIKHYNTEQFIEKARRVHGEKYNYSKVNYVDSQNKVCIICQKHGEFFQTPSEHLQGYGCPACGGRQRLTLKQFIEKAKKFHGDKYDYSKTNYINGLTKVEIKCNKCKTTFWQIPAYHLSGEGCPKCKQSHMENKVENILQLNNVSYKAQKKFSWLGLQSLDFFLPEHNIAVECQGVQHFELTRFKKANESNYAEELFQKVKERDLRKYNLCKENYINLFYYIPKNSEKYIDNEEYNFIYTKDNVITNIEKFIKKLVI